MQIDQHIRNLRFIRGKVGKARTPKDHEKIGKEVSDAIKKIVVIQTRYFTQLTITVPQISQLKKL